MGVDACIYIKTISNKEPILSNHLPEGFEIIPADELVEEATHEIDNCFRYYDPDYPRGNWPLLFCVLLELLSCKEIEKVWYFGDNYSAKEPITFETLIEYSKFYIENANDPYRKR